MIDDTLEFGEVKEKGCVRVRVVGRERERASTRAQAGEGQRERETQNLKQASGSELSAQSPMRGWNSRTVRS